MSLSETPNDAPPPSEEEIAETRKWLTSAADWRVERGELQSQVLSVFDRLVAERDRLAASVAVYAKYLGEVVAFGTDAAELDRQLCECLEERDALLAENEQLKDECARLRTDVAVADYIRRVAKTIDECGGWSQLDKPWKARRLKAAINIATMTKAEFEAAIDLARKAQGGE